MFIKLSRLVFCGTLFCISVRSVSRKGISLGLRMKRFKMDIDWYWDFRLLLWTRNKFFNREIQSLGEGEVANSKIRSQELVYPVLYLPTLKCFLWSRRSTNFRNVQNREFVGKKTAQNFQWSDCS